MKAAETSTGPSPPPQLSCPLYKPLHELTEDDIAQVTREDCRRFLKEKGMRRPSWNKSQAIQQVISLKALLEAKPDPDDDGDAGDAPSSSSALRKSPDPPPPSVSALPPPPAPARPRPPPPPPERNALFPPSCEEAPYRRRDPGTSLFSQGESTSFRIPASAAMGGFPPEISGANLRVAAAAAGPPPPPPPAPGQMAIFYGGKVNIYDGVAPDKALAIMRVAAAPDPFCDAPPPQPPVHQFVRPVLISRPPLVPAVAPLPPPPPLPLWNPPAEGVMFSQHIREGAEEWRSSRETEPEGPTSRRASLQRYLEKRKDRKTFKFKRNVDGLFSSSIEIFMTQNVRCQAPNGLLCQNDASSPSQPKPPSTPSRCSGFMEKQTQNTRFSIDLNDDDVQEI